VNGTKPKSKQRGGEMDRGKNNRKLRDLVQEHRTSDGAIPALDVPDMVNRLIALLDECVDEAYTTGERDATDGYPD
jgi:hypothetical protein